MISHKEHSKGLTIEDRVRIEREKSGSALKDGLSVKDRATKSMIAELDK